MRPTPVRHAALIILRATLHSSFYARQFAPRNMNRFALMLTEPRSGVDPVGHHDAAADAWSSLGGPAVGGDDLGFGHG